MVYSFFILTNFRINITLFLRLSSIIHNHHEVKTNHKSTQLSKNKQVPTICDSRQSTATLPHTR